MIFISAWIDYEYGPKVTSQKQTRIKLLDISIERYFNFIQYLLLAELTN